jgi:TetR/AcrR family transcriptional regulator, regulator of cefoperazone and chloramphenicol sensitivity
MHLRIKEHLITMGGLSMGTTKDSEKTRAKLIEAAGQLFAENGYNGVTVRDIAKKADTHLSALNYHFRTKEALYREIILEACKFDSISLQDQQKLLEHEPHEALLLFVEETLRDSSKNNNINWQATVINRECWEPSKVFEEVVEKYFSPETKFLSQIIGNTVNQPPSSFHVRFAVIVLMSLLETFRFYRHLIDAIAPGLSDYLEQKESLPKMITQLVIEAANPPLAKSAPN